MKLIKTIIICQQCQMPYYKAFWEPMWLAKLAAKENHEEWHEMAMHPETTPLAETWREWERERIIKLLFTWGIKSREENNWRDDVIALELIKLIKGEQK